MKKMFLPGSWSNGHGIARYSRCLLGGCFLAVLACGPGSVHGEATTYSGATLINSLPVTISTPGVYYLAQDFAFDSSSTGRTPCISVSVPGVTIDLNGHTVTDTYNVNNPNGSDGVSFTYTGQNTTIRNGTLVGFYSAVNLGTGCLAENLTLVASTQGAISIGGSNSRIYRCRALQQNSAPGPFTCFSINGSGNTVEDCEIKSKTGSNVITGIQVYGGASNFVINNRMSGIDYGLNAGTNVTKYRDNLMVGVVTPYVGGTNAGNNN